MSKLLRKLVPQFLINYFKHLPSAILANIFYGFPSKGIKFIGVTGTDGKTTTVNMIYQILIKAGLKVSMVSTINAEIGGKIEDTGFHVTNPNSWALQKYIRKAKNAGTKIMVLEVTSHGLDQFRVWGINFEVGVITNVTNEHLDYHKTYANYLEAKSQLIKDVKFAVLNTDENYFSKLSKKTNGKVISFGNSTNANYNPENFPFKLKTPGSYNVLNGLAAAAVTSLLGIDKKVIKEALENFEILEGRMNEIVNNKGIRIIIDYAHTPNGLLNAIRASRKGSGKLITLIGAEGERDPGKREPMGRIAAENADFTIITAVDPRGDIENINKEILEGAERAGGILNKNIFVVNDRQKAIDFAINTLAKKGDTVALFGKGHENSMNIDGKVELPWSDKKAVIKVLKSS